MKLKRVKFYSGLVIFLFLALNVLACRHAYLMTHFTIGGPRTRGPEQLSGWEHIAVLFTGVSIPKPPIRAKPAGGTYRTVRIADHLEAWDIDGNGEVVVMFPGHATSKSALLESAKAFHELGCRCVLVDFRGCGGSDGVVCTMGWDEADDVTAAVDWARHEYPGRHIIVQGESMGAAALLRAISTEGLKPDAIMVECVFDRFITTVGHRNQAMYLPAFPLAHLLLFWGGVQLGFNPFHHNPIEYATSVTSPALVIGGEFDPWVKPSETSAVAGAMHGPTTVKVFENAGHGAYIWSDPEAYRQTLRDWLAGVRLRWSKVSG